MGGLVIKRAYILSKQKQESVSLADRVQAIFFLATPHRGSDLAPLLSKLLNLSGGARPFVTDLHRNSLATQSINDESPNTVRTYNSTLSTRHFQQAMASGAAL